MEEPGDASVLAAVLPRLRQHGRHVAHSMTFNHAGAIIRWRDHVETLEGGPAGFEQSATISTMLFGCHRWLTNNAQHSTPDEIERIQ